jgi:hypothetical protein
MATVGDPASNLFAMDEPNVLCVSEPEGKYIVAYDRDANEVRLNAAPLLAHSNIGDTPEDEAVADAAEAVVGFLREYPAACDAQLTTAAFFGVTGARQRRELDEAVGRELDKYR